MREKVAASTRTPVLHHYGRISDPVQRRGGGMVRQATGDVSGFCDLFGFVASKRMWVDDGVSAFHGLNATPNHELGKFLAEARRGTIRPGDCLLIENYDRLSREDPWAAISLVNDLRQLGIHVGRLDRMKLLRCDSTDIGDFFECAMEFIRGHSESAMKSHRNGAAWARKRKAAREGGQTVTKAVPAWIKVVEGRRELIPERARAVCRIYELAEAGYGISRIIRKLDEEEHKPFGQHVVREGRKRSAYAGRWTHAYVALLLRDRRVLGEYQPCGKGRQPTGPPIPGYFPAVITEEQWFATLAGRRGTGRRTRIGKHVNLFAGLLRNARNGDRYNYADKGTRCFCSSGSSEGRSPAWTFPVAVFETAVVSKLREIKAKEILEGEGPPDQTETLRGELTSVEAEYDEAKEYLDTHRFNPALAEKVQKLYDRKEDLTARLALARQDESHPLSEAWGEAQALATLLEKANTDPDIRVRLRAALGRILSEVWLLVAPAGRNRICFVQIHFTDRPATRTYLIYYSAGGFHKEASWSVHSGADVIDERAFDLRRADDVSALLNELSTWRPPSPDGE